MNIKSLAFCVLLNTLFVSFDAVKLPTCSPEYFIQDNNHEPDDKAIAEIKC